MRFCPRCGLRDDAANTNAGPQAVSIPGDTLSVGNPLAFGQVSNLYRCTIERAQRNGVFKIARTHLANLHIARESQTLRQLHERDTERWFVPFLPRPLATIQYANSNGEPARLANVLAYHDGISGPDELYSLEEVRSTYPEGIDPRDMAWIWRRLLTVLGFIHEQRVVHGMVTPDHVLIEPQGHKLVLVGWCGSVSFGAPAVLEPTRWDGWRSWHGGASAEVDLASAAKTMLYLLSSTAEPAIMRHLERAGESMAGAWRLLDDFDRMIEALWGPRQFRAFSMPPRAS